MSNGTVFDIQPFSVYDGPGIRTTVFLKGCNLRCRWCHNPESWMKDPQLGFYPEKCIGCGSCFQACPSHVHKIENESPRDTVLEKRHSNAAMGIAPRCIALECNDDVHRLSREDCTVCGICADQCYTGALEITGKIISAEEIFSRILEDRPYYENSGGGVTFSGGEPLLQIDFLYELLTLCKNAGIHTAVDTAGAVPFSFFRQIIPVTDLFLFDLKAFDDSVHRDITGISNQDILQNLEVLSTDTDVTAYPEIIVRIPCIKGANLSEMENIAGFLEKRNVLKAELLAYHRLGEGKRDALGLKTEESGSESGYRFGIPDKEEMAKILKLFTDRGIPAVYKE